MRRREFIVGLGSAAAWPTVAPAQQGDRVRRIGVFVPFDENDPVSKTFVSAFTQALAGLGWIDGRNARMDLRWSGGDDTNRIRALAKELVGLQPDIILVQRRPIGRDDEVFELDRRVHGLWLAVGDDGRGGATVLDLVIDALRHAVRMPRDEEDIALGDRPLDRDVPARRHRPGGRRIVSHDRCWNRETHASGLAYAIPSYGYLEERPSVAGLIYVKCTALQLALHVPRGDSTRSIV